MISRKVSFQTDMGIELQGRLDKPENQKPKAYIIYVPCFTCTKEIHIAYRLSNLLIDKGFGMLRFDMTGLGESGGDFSQTSFRHNLIDIKAAVDFLCKNEQEPQFLIGHSLGGTACLVTAADLKMIKGVVTLNAPYHPNHVARHFKDVRFNYAPAQLPVTITIEGRQFEVGPQFFETLNDYEMDIILKKLKVALLIFHAPNDSIVKIENGHKIFEQALYPKNFISLDQATHLISQPSQAQYIADIIDIWSQPYLEV